MAQFEKTVNQKYFFRWWNDQLASIDPRHLKALEETAVEHIQKQRVMDYTSGHMTDNIHMYDTDPEDGIEYQGYWEWVEEQPRTVLLYDTQGELYGVYQIPASMSEDQFRKLFLAYWKNDEDEEDFDYYLRANGHSQVQSLLFSSIHTQ